MNDLSDRARQMLERYKGAESMPPVEKDRALEAVLARGARGELPRFDVNAHPPTMAKVGWSLSTKMWVAVGVAALPVAVAVRAIAHHEPAPASTPSQPQALAVEPSSATPAQAPEIAAAAPTEPAAAAPTPVVASVDAPRRSGQATSAPRASAPGASGSEAPSAPTIDGEMLLLNQAQLATRAGNPGRALQLFDEYGAQFPNGRLADTRAVGRMVALCDLGQVAEVRREAEQFKARYPNSPFSNRVNKICAAKSP